MEWKPFSKDLSCGFYWIVDPDFPRLDILRIRNEWGKQMTMLWMNQEREDDYPPDDNAEWLYRSVVMGPLPEPSVDRFVEESA